MIRLVTIRRRVTTELYTVVSVDSSNEAYAARDAEAKARKQWQDGEERNFCAEKVETSFEVVSIAPNY